MPVTPTTRRQVRQRASELCEYCHANEQWQFVRFTVDHVVPRSSGGSDGVENLALACRNCNERRSNRSDWIDPESGERVAIFDPRRNEWNQHFTWSQDKTRIVGQTPTGNATVALLDLNDERHGGVVVRIRKRDVDDGFHPPSGDRVLSP